MVMLGSASGILSVPATSNTPPSIAKLCPLKPPGASPVQDQGLPRVRSVRCRARMKAAVD
jgi:hypothetical protein